MVSQSGLQTGFALDLHGVHSPFDALSRIKGILHLYPEWLSFCDYLAHLLNDERCWYDITVEQIAACARPFMTVHFK
jgi:hypothetical protein